LQFFAAGKTHHQRLIRGGNQVRKSWACAFEVALHLTPCAIPVSATNTICGRRGACPAIRQRSWRRASTSTFLRDGEPMKDYVDKICEKTATAGVQRVMRLDLGRSTTTKNRLPRPKRHLSLSKSK
jgi:hypothetical protein